MRLFDPFLYEKVHLLIVLAFSLYFFFRLQNVSSKKLLMRKRSSFGVYIYVLLFIIVVGLRPISSAFGDTVNYALGYEDFSLTAERIIVSRDSLFYSFMWLCSQHISVYWFFFIVEILYVLPITYACYRLLHKNADIGVLFCIASFSFFSYSVNGIRNGMALSLVLLALTYIQGDVKDKIICGILSAFAISFHASATLPVLCMVLTFVIKKPKWLFYFWGLSIIVSLLAGNTVSSFFAGLGFDDRLSDYILSEVDESLFSHVGFRWDFLLYSTVPVIWGVYIIYKKRVCDKQFIILLGTYLLANAFWIMVIRAGYSNRFAYLSWFLYPIVISYPLLKLKIWPKTQGQKTAMIMMAHLAFTLFMVFFVY